MILLFLYKLNNGYRKNQPKWHALVSKSTKKMLNLHRICRVPATRTPSPPTRVGGTYKLVCSNVGSRRAN